MRLARPGFGERGRAGRSDGKSRQWRFSSPQAVRVMVAVLLGVVVMMNGTIHH